jgi:hypothetical protein
VVEGTDIHILGAVPEDEFIRAVTGGPATP